MSNKERPRKSSRKTSSQTPEGYQGWILGFDSEWVTKGDKNTILSYQWWLIKGDRGAGGILYPKDLGKRASLKGFIGKVLQTAKNKEKLFHHYPRHLMMVAHFSLADLAAFDDFHDGIKAAFPSVRKTHVTFRPREQTWTDSSRNQRNIRIELRDSMLMAPNGSRLEDLGNLHSIPKIELPAGRIERMDLLLKEDRALFEKYAIQDARITAVHASKMAEMNYKLVGENHIPISLGSMAVDYCMKLWEATNISYLDVLGKEEVEQEVYNPVQRRNQRRRTLAYINDVHENDSFAVEGYHGGRNEAFYFGASSERDWRDIDLVGAYSTAMATLGMIKWDTIRFTKELKNFTLSRVGIARVKFRFPPDTRFPGLPVRVDDNLIFPMSGETVVTAAEIAVAIEQGCKIEILKGLVIDQCFETSPFQKIVKSATDSRNAAKEAGRDLEQKLYKELINSFYGKFAQGLRKKRIFNTLVGETEDMPPSRITQSYIAGHITGLVRAVLSEIMNKLPEEYEIISVTTDGFITDAPEAVMETLLDGPICKLLKETRMSLVGNENILETKHEVRQVLCWRTRGQATLKNSGSGKAPLLAKAGLKSPRGYSEDKQNDWILQNFVDRSWDTTFDYDRLRGMRDLYEKGGDLVTETHTQRLNMDFDFKRRVNKRRITTRQIRGIDHVAFETLPWHSIEEYKECRELSSTFKTDTQSCLKTKGELKLFLEKLGSKANFKGNARLSPRGLINTATNIVIRAMVHEMWELSLQGKSKKYWKERLSEAGFPAKTDTFKKAKSWPPPEAYLIEMTDETLSLAYWLQNEFPDFDFNYLFADRYGKHTRHLENIPKVDEADSEI